MYICRSIVISSDLLVQATSILALSAHVCNEEDDSKHEADTSDDNVADSKEEVLSSKNISGRQDEVFASFKGANIKVIDDLQSIFSWLKV